MMFWLTQWIHKECSFLSGIYTRLYLGVKPDCPKKNAGNVHLLQTTDKFKLSISLHCNFTYLSVQFRQKKKRNLVRFRKISCFGFKFCSGLKKNSWRCLKFSLNGWGCPNLPLKVSIYCHHKHSWKLSQDQLKMSRGFTFRNLETWSLTVVADLATMPPCTSTSRYERQVLHMWYDTTCRNVTVVRIVYDVQIWTHQLFAETLTANILTLATWLRGQQNFSHLLTSISMSMVQHPTQPHHHM